MNPKEMIREKIEQMLQEDFFCTRQELNFKDTILTVNATTDKPFIKIMAYRDAVIVCTSGDLLEKIKILVQGKSRDEIFELPFVYGQTIHYVPDQQSLDAKKAPDGFEYEIICGNEIAKLVGITGFFNSLEFDESGCTPTSAVCLAKREGHIVGIAGAAPSISNDVWELGVDVIPDCRNTGLGSYLVDRLTKELLQKGIIPFIRHR